MPSSPFRISVVVGHFLLGSELQFDAQRLPATARANGLIIEAPGAGNYNRCHIHGLCRAAPPEHPLMQDPLP